MGFRDKLKKAGKAYGKVRKGYESYKAKEPERLKKQSAALSQKVSIERKKAQLRKLRGNSMGTGLGSMSFDPNKTSPLMAVPSTKKKKPKRRRPKRIGYY